ncbi:GPI transamidase component PIG-T [Sarcoptes scabiei]|nr:GPI transamidase component PIG-T [Sarcoptes scabiei]
MVFWNVLTPRFYLALTASSFIISIIILLFEWWYFTSYGVSFIEQVLINFIAFVTGNDSQRINDNSIDDENQTDYDHVMHGTILANESIVWRNPLSLFRGSEYNQLTLATNKEPLTFYDMNLSAQEHQVFFTCESDIDHPDMEIMLTAWRERDPEIRIKSAHKALEKNPGCAPAYILLAEEEAKTVAESEQIFLTALKVAEAHYNRSYSNNSTTITNSSSNNNNNSINSNSNYNNTNNNNFTLNPSPQSILKAQQRRDLKVLIYIRRRLAVCARKLGRLKESVKMLRDLIKEFPMMNRTDIHENLIEALLEMNAYADVQTLLAKYDYLNLPNSATICYTSALLKSRCIGDKFSPDVIVKRGLSVSEINAVEAIHRAVEFNPYVPEYLLETRKLIFPPEHVVRRGDSEAIAYAFFHLPHWKRVEGALNLLDCTWKGTFRILPFPLNKGHPFSHQNYSSNTDRELLPGFWSERISLTKSLNSIFSLSLSLSRIDYHKVSVYPKKTIPFFIRFTTSFCTLTAVMTFIFYQYPMQIIFFVQTVYSSRTISRFSLIRS